MAERGKTIAFIDNSNVFKGQQKAGWRIDVEKLHRYLEKNGGLWQVFFFASATDPPRFQQTNFYNFLKNKMRYEVKLYSLGRKTINCKKCGQSTVVYAEKGADVGVATKLLVLANNRAFETAILVAGDRDYLETVQAVKAQGLRVEIMAWRGSISDAMEAESSRQVTYFDDIRVEIERTAPPDTEADALTEMDV
jgi:uncharacterized LabA/DUF88 family protein